MDRKKLVERIRALKAKTIENGCTEEEAAAAAEMVAKLLERYNISAEECDVRENEFNQYSHTQDDLVGRRLFVIADAIAYLVEVRYWIQRPGEKATVNFFGFDHEVEIASYLLDICRNAMETQSKKIEHENRLLRENIRRRKTIAFIDGMSDRLAQRIKALKPKRPTGTGIIILRDALIDAELKNRDINLHDARTRETYDLDENYRRGLSAGDKVALNQGIRGTDNLQRLKSR